MKKSYRCWTEIDLDALRGNLAWIRHHVGKDVKVITVVKADAYGHGLKQIAALLMQSGTDVFGVANLAEAAAIRSVGKGWPILMLGACLPEEVEVAIRDQVMATLSSLAEAEAFSKKAVALGTTARVHVKIDTGMGRLGALPFNARALIDTVRNLPGLALVGIYTHYSSVEGKASFSRKQRQLFQSLLEDAQLDLSEIEFLHVNNSGGVLFEPESTYNTVRPGLLVYGLIPKSTRAIPNSIAERLRPALSWKCRIGLVKTVPVGHALSYGGMFVTRRETRVAAITAGYGDGFLRAGSGRARVLVNGKLCPVLGRVTMDQMLIDVTQVKRAVAGDEVVLIGKQGGGEIKAHDLADWCGTIAWEVLTNINYRVPRLYRGEHAA